MRACNGEIERQEAEHRADCAHHCVYVTPEKQPGGKESDEVLMSTTGSSDRSPPLRHTHTYTHRDIYTHTHTAYPYYTPLWTLCESNRCACTPPIPTCPQTHTNTYSLNLNTHKHTSCVTHGDLNPVRMWRDVWLCRSKVTRERDVRCEHSTSAGGGIQMPEQHLSAGKSA